MLMKKVLNITMVQQALRRLPIAFLIAGSGFLPNASAVRYTIDFKDKKGGGHIEASDLADFRDLINVLGPKKSLEDQKKYEFKFLIALGTKIPGTGLRFEHIVESGDNSKVTIVLKDGILEDQEAKKLLDGVKMSFNIEFINCSGTLDLNEDLKEHAERIYFEKCDFKTVANCFKNAKLLQFVDTKITPEDRRLGILKPTKVQVGGTNTVLRPLKDVVIFERNEFSDTTLAPKNGRLGIGKTTTVGIDGNNKFFPYNMSLEIKRNNKDDAQYKSKITELEEEIKGKDSTISNLRAKVQELEQNEISNLRARVQELEKNEISIRNELVVTIRNRNKEQEILSSLYKTTQKQLEDAKRNNQTNKTVIEEMKGRNAQLRKENEKLSKKQGRTEGYAKNLEASKSELEAINKKLEADNIALREEILKSSETVRTAKETLKKFKDLQERNERLLKASHNNSDEIESLTKNIREKDRKIRELEALLGIASSFINNVHPLLRDLKENDEYIRNALVKVGYGEEVKKFNQSLRKLYEAGKERKKQHKSGWIDFNFEEPFSVLDDDDNDETYRKNKTIYRGRGNLYGRGCRGRGGYRGNCRGRGCGSKPMINKPRGGKRGGDQRDPFDSDNH